MEYQVEDLMKDCIRAKHLLRGEVCKGLCSESSLCKYLGGERNMDRLMFNILLQRIGLSPDNFTMMVGRSEYRYFEWRVSVIRALRSGQWEKVEELLGKGKKRRQNGKPDLREQFQRAVSGVVAAEYYKDEDRALKLFEDAIKVTVPDFTEECVQEPHLWGREEIGIILSYLELKGRNEAESAKITGYLGKFFDWIERGDIEAREKAKILPLIAKVYGDLLIKDQNYEKCSEICRETLEIMGLYNISGMLEQVLSLYIAAMERMGREEKIGREKNWLAGWQGIRKLLGAARCDVVMAYVTTFGQEILLYDEVIRSERKQAGIRIEDLSYLSDCDSISLRRIENGRCTPRTGSFRKITRALNIREECYYGDISGDCREVYALKYQCDLNVMHKEHEKNRELLNRLEGHLDMDVSENRQYIEDARNMMDFAAGDIDAAEYLRREKQALAYTTDMDIDRPFKGMISSQETVVIIHIARCYMKIENFPEAARLLEELLAYYDRSKVCPEFHFRNVSLILGNLSQVYLCEGQWERGEDVGRRGMEFVINCDKGRGLGALLNNYAVAMYEDGNPAAGKEYFKLAAGLADFYHNGALKKTAERNYTIALKMEISIM